MPERFCFKQLNKKATGFFSSSGRNWGREGGNPWLFVGTVSACPWFDAKLVSGFLVYSLQVESQNPKSFLISFFCCSILLVVLFTGDKSFHVSFRISDQIISTRFCSFCNSLPTMPSRACFARVAAISSFRSENRFTHQSLRTEQHFISKLFGGEPGPPQA